jgi:Fe2+ or Zn2+ uptake regulation protein
VRRASRPTAAPTPIEAAVASVLAPGELRLTANRRALLAALDKAPRPLTADELAGSAGVALSSAYRNLAELAAAGVVARVSTGGIDCFELDEQFSDHSHHHHLMCVECGIVTDFAPSPQLERLISREVEELAAQHGCEVVSHVFDVRGLCRDCRSRR